MVDVTTTNILNHFLHCFLLLFLFGEPIVAQSSPRAYFDESQNLIQNTKDNVNWNRFASIINNNKSPHKADLSIVHIGDSHIQGGYYTNRFRELLCESYGIKQRGFVFPYSLVKTNGPEDVKFYSNSSWSGEKYNHSHSRKKAGISGYYLHLNDSVGTISVVLKHGMDPLLPFQELVIYHNNKNLRVYSALALRTTVDSIGDQLFTSHIFFNNRVDSISLRIQSRGFLTQFYGFELKNNQTGIVYHSMGINGASFDTFTNEIDYMSLLKTFHPDCIIISLGTNDSYLRQVDTSALKNKISVIIEKVKSEFPGSCILLATPGDHLIHNKYFNENLIKTRAAIISVALRYQCAYWDFFSVMGGLGSSKRWAQHGLMYKDMLHLSKEGYKLQADLFFEAFEKAVDEAMTNNK
jgi:lysophospholipase L1-like esterase